VREKKVDFFCVLDTKTDGDQNRGFVGMYLGLDDFKKKKSGLKVFVKRIGTVRSFFYIQTIERFWKRNERQMICVLDTMNNASGLTGF